MDLELGGKVAIVTGGSKGIGRATAIRFVEEGASVLICARGKEALAETAALARKVENGAIETIRADLGKIDDLRKVAARCVEKFGSAVQAAQWDHILLRSSQGTLKLDLCNLFDLERSIGEDHPR
jgi:NAD(P)-dependent dehydrogenase (short-subunit alcohol dehydrogenase family)